MLFVEFAFLPFFLTVLGVHWLLPSHAARKAWLLLASLCFYGAWDWRFLGLILLSTALDYGVGLRLERPGARRAAWMALSLAGNLGLLAFFKYFGFFVDSAVELLGTLGFQAHRPTLAIVLPVGISFYTFQTLSYSLDVYRRELRATRSLLDFALFVCFFPQLVAGPIVRAAAFLPQLEGQKRFSAVDARAALLLFLVGYFKKACVSDTLAPLVDRYFAAPGDYDALSAWTAVLAYAAQIYCDFSGYSDMAIALAALLGYELRVNFDRPYLARDIVDFWRRWHISLSTWLRDYLYIPLGGNRGGRLRTYRNLLLTMLLGGLWHGAAWSFVLWGGLHGLALAGVRLWRELRPSAAHGSRSGAVLAWAATLYFVCFCWIFFRAQDMERALTVARGFVLLDSPGPEALERGYLGLLLALFGLHAFAHPRWSARLTRAWRALPAWGFSFSYGVAAALVLALVPANPRPFIYFQF
jgi:alginate O-acetyltransferase complex protein AlgI